MYLAFSALIASLAVVHTASLKDDRRLFQPMGGELSNLLLSYVEEQQSMVNQTLAIMKQVLAGFKSFQGFCPGNKYNVSAKCLTALESVTQSRQAMEAYLDASGKIPAGLLGGNNRLSGAYGECLRISGAHYCGVSNIKVMNQPLVVNLCIPSLCSESDVESLLGIVAACTNNTVIQLYEDQMLLQIYQKYAICTSGDAKIYPGTVVMIVILSILGILCLVGTVADYVQERQHSYSVNGYANIETNKELMDAKTAHLEQSSDTKGVVSMHSGTVDKGASPLVRFLLCFSVFKNSRAVLDTSVPNGAITSINGMRTLSITWVILGHTISFMTTLQNTENVLDAYFTLQRWTMQAILNASVSVDTFFFLSGLLVGYLSLKRYFASGSLPLLRYYVHRYIRLTPSLLMVILFAMYVFPSLGSGPFWAALDLDGPLTKPCREKWWTNILYINNFYPPELQQECIGWVWYLANDMQFYVISPLILYVMYRFKLLGTLVVNGLLVLACMMITAMLIGWKHLTMVTPLIGALVGNNNEEFNNRWVYSKPWTRIAPYCVGLVLAYILAKKIKIGTAWNSHKIIVGWMLATGTALAIIYGPYSSKTHVWTHGENIAYGTLFRFLWACCLAWVVYACHNGHGGIVNKLLSWKAWVPLSRLTYGAYLVHPLVIFYLYASVESPMHFTMTEMVYHFLGVTMLSYMVAYILAMLVEFPVFNLEQLYLNL